MDFLKKLFKKTTPEAGQTGEEKVRSFAVFLSEAGEEIEKLIDANPNWYEELPYTGKLPPEEARALEIEKRALFRRVIYDAARTQLPGLKWEASRDAKVCPECRDLDNRIFPLSAYDQLNQMVMHTGCRCNLIPVRNLETGE